MSFTVFRSNVLPLYRPLAWKNYVLDRSLRKPFSSNVRWAYVPQLSSSMNPESLKTLVRCPFPDDRIFAGLQPGLSIEWMTQGFYDSAERY
jgi:hypothetical protein